MEQRLSTISLGVADLERSKRFYLDGLGWTQVDDDAEGICFIQLPSIVLGLYGWDALAEDMALETIPTGPGFRGFALAYNTTSEEETDQVLAEAVAAGATLLKEAERVFWGGYSGYFADPDGHPWEVAYNPYTTPNDDGTFVM